MMLRQAHLCLRQGRDSTSFQFAIDDYSKDHSTLSAKTSEVWDSPNIFHSSPIGWHPHLAHGIPTERANVQIAGAGFGLHWPNLDEDIGVEEILLSTPFTESPQSFEKWLKAQGSENRIRNSQQIQNPVLYLEVYL